VFSVHGKRNSRGGGPEVHLHRGRPRPGKRRGGSQPALVDTLQKLKGICKLRDLKRPSLSVVDLTTESRLRKLVEYVYQDEEVDIVIYTGSSKRATRAPEQETDGVEHWKIIGVTGTVAKEIAASHQNYLFKPD
jgi:hypothetical protein